MVLLFGWRLAGVLCACGQLIFSSLRFVVAAISFYSRCSLLLCVLFFIKWNPWINGNCFLIQIMCSFCIYSVATMSGIEQKQNFTIFFIHVSLSRSPISLHLSYTSLRFWHICQHVSVSSTQTTITTTTNARYMKNKVTKLCKSIEKIQMNTIWLNG